MGAFTPAGETEALVSINSASKEAWEQKKPVLQTNTVSASFPLIPLQRKRGSFFITSAWGNLVYSVSINSASKEAWESLYMGQ